jgi:hypothetical protein
MRAHPSVRAQVELKVLPSAAQWAAFQQHVRPLAPRVTVSSFLPAAVRAATARGYPTTYITRVPVLPSSIPAGTDWVDLERTQGTQAQVDAYTAAGLKVRLWQRDHPPTGSP